MQGNQFFNPRLNTFEKITYYSNNLIIFAINYANTYLYITKI